MMFQRDSGTARTRLRPPRYRPGGPGAPGRATGRSRRRDPQPLWQRAIDLAGDNDEHLAQALAGLAGSGAEELPRFEEFATRHP